MKTEDLIEDVTRAEFLGLTPEDEAIVNIRLAVHRKLREARKRSGLSQTAVAERIGSSQSRIAKAEAGKQDVSLDLMIRASVASGATAKEIGEAIRATAVCSMNKLPTAFDNPREAARKPRKVFYARENQTKTEGEIICCPFCGQELAHTQKSILSDSLLTVTNYVRSQGRWIKASKGAQTRKNHPSARARAACSSQRKTGGHARAKSRAKPES